MKKLFFSLIVLHCFSLSHAQVPGFIGKRFSGGLDLHLFPTLTKGGISLGITPGIGANLEFVTSRKASIFAEFASSTHKFYTTEFGLDPSALTPPSTNEINGVSAVDGTGHNRYFKGSVRDFTFGIKKYKKDFISPIGRYFKIGFALIMYGQKDWDHGWDVSVESYTGGSTIYYNSIIKSNTKTFFKPAFLIGFGKSIALSSRLIFDFHVDTKIAQGFLSRTNNSYFYRADDVVESLIWNDLKFREALRIGLGLKFMIG